MSEPDGRAPARADLAIVGVAGALVLAVLWLKPLASSLWLDELATWWSVQGGLATALERATSFQGQSPGYQALAWAVAEVAGPREWALRLPSLLVSILSVVLLYRLILRLIGRDAAAFAALGLVGLDAVAFAATEFRPYAWALCAVIASMLALVRWVERGRWLEGLIYVAATALVAWGHYFFVLALVAQPIYLAVVGRSGVGKVRWRQVLLAWGAVVLLWVPLAPSVTALWNRRASLSIPYDASVIEYLVAVFRPGFVSALIVGMLIATLLGVATVRVTRGVGGAAALLWSWLLIPPTIMFLGSTLGPFDLYSPRYYLSAAPAAAGLFGWAVSSVGSPEARRAVGLVFAIFAVLLGATAGAKLGDDWRGAAALEREVAAEDALVLLHPSLVEADDPAILADVEGRAYLTSPASFYPLDGDIEPLPYSPDVDGLTYLSSLLDRELGQRDQLLLVSGRPSGQLGYRAWLEGRLEPEGWHVGDVTTIGAIEVVEFTRDAR